jgi:hypothetical protein
VATEESENMAKKILLQRIQTTKSNMLMEKGAK